MSALSLPARELAAVTVIVPAIMAVVLVGTMLMHLVDAVKSYTLQMQHAELLQRRKLELSLKKDWERFTTDEQERVQTLIDNMIELIGSEQPPQMLGVPLRPTFLVAVQGYVVTGLSLVLGKIMHDVLASVPDA